MGEQQGWIAGGLAGAFAALIRISWPVRRERWFWAVATFFAAGDALAVHFIDWSFTDKWNGHEFSGLILMDFGIMMAVVYGVFCIRHGRPANVIADEPDEPNYSDREINP